MTPTSLDSGHEMPAMADSLAMSPARQNGLPRKRGRPLGSEAGVSSHAQTRQLLNVAESELAVLASQRGFRMLLTGWCIVLRTTRVAPCSAHRTNQSLPAAAPTCAVGVGARKDSCACSRMSL